MISYVLDASALLRFTDKEAGYDRIGDLLKQAAKGKTELLISAINWAEIVTALYKRSGGNQAAVRVSTGNLAALPVTIVPVDQVMAESAAEFKANLKLPFADAFAAALTLLSSADTGKQPTTLVTADFDFKSVSAGILRVEFLPAK
jgi:predicted nucleic acid-binding protein